VAGILIALFQRLRQLPPHAFPTVSYRHSGLRPAIRAHKLCA